MGESSTHKKLKTKLAGPRGRVEVPVPKGRLDAAMREKDLAIQVLMDASKKNVRRAIGGINNSPYQKGLISAPQRLVATVAEQAHEGAKKPIVVVNRKGEVKARITQRRSRKGR